MPRKGENIYKRKDGRWEGRYIREYVNSRAKYGFIYGKTYLEVKNKLIKKKADIQNQQTAEQDSNGRFGEIAEEWLNYCRLYCKESTIMKYKNLLHYIEPYLNKRFINQIETEDIINMCKELSIRGGRKKKGLSQKTISDLMSVIRRIRKFAVNEHYIVHFETDYTKIKTEDRKLRVFSKEEQRVLQDYLLKQSDYCNKGILLCLYTGLRIGELCALKWGDISFSNQTLFVHRTLFRIQTDEKKPKTKICITTPKSASSIRTIPLPDFIMNILQAASVPPDAYFLTGSKEHFMEPRVVQYRYKTILQKCRIADANFHALRHTFATRCIEVGFDLKSLSEILGHSDVKITLNRYVHPTMDLKRLQMNKLTEHII